MDYSIIYLTALLLTLILSWVVFRYSSNSNTSQDQLLDQIDSLSGFIKYSFVMLILLFFVWYSDHKFVGESIEVLFGNKNRPYQYREDSFNFMGIILPFVSVFFGSILFQYGFLRMSEFLLARNIPRSKIRSAALGLVEIQGEVISEQVLTTPYSKSPCVYYSCELQEYRRNYSSGSGIEYQWETISTETHRMPFWVKDETGQIPVFPNDAEFEIPQKKSGFLENAGEDTNSRFMTARVGDKRYYEYYLSPHENVCVLGTLAVRNNTSIPKGIHKGSGKSVFIISDSSKNGLNDALKWQMLAGLFFGSPLITAGVVKILQLALVF